jgi:hypothetical protein
VKTIVWSALCAIFFLTQSAEAVQLTVLSVATNATNSAIPLGEQVVTFGIQVRQSDLIGAGTNPVLSVHNLTFAGNGIVPINLSGTPNRVDVQTVQTKVVDLAAGNTSPAPATQADLTANQQKSVYADSWWYNSPTGTLQGINDDAGDTGTITDPAFQLGPLGHIGASGYTWTPNGAAGVQAGATAAAAVASASGTNATTGQYMMYSGTYGPAGANSLTTSLLSSMFFNGELTIPIAQIVTTGDLLMPGDYSNAGGGLPGLPGSGTYIQIAGDGVSNGPTGNGTYNISGGDPNVSPSCHSHYHFDAVAGGGFGLCPEPSSYVMASLGAAGLFFSSWRARSKPRR